MTLEPPLSVLRRFRDLPPRPRTGGREVPDRHLQSSPCSASTVPIP
ncbi:hypothetical protein [Actinomadura vinacea]